MIAGGLGGVAYWGPVYPADVIKSRMQVDSLTNPQYRGMLDCFRKVAFSGLCCEYGPVMQDILRLHCSHRHACGPQTHICSTPSTFLAPYTKNLHCEAARFTCLICCTDDA